MSSHDKEQSHCDAYEKILDLDLFNALLALVVKMSDNKDAMLEYSRFISQKSLWASRCNDPGAYFAQHELRYIGEITERFEERIGSRPEIFRALALALGFALPFLTDSMFVGTQREDFIRRLDKEAGNDLYLQGARYLLTTDPMERKQLRSQLAGDTYQRTEDAMFVLSLFDPQEDEFPAMRPQIARLWGVDRTIPLLGNGRMLDWLLCNYVQEYTAGSRTRKAFDFNKKLLETYDVTEYPDLFESHSGFHRDYMKSIRYYYSDLGKLDFKRDFLSSDEQRQLFEWIDTSQFCLEPQSYYNFVEAALWNDCVRALYDKETLREVLKALIATRYNIHSVNSLKQDLYTQEELDAEKEQQQAEWERIRQERRANSLATKKERLDAKFDGSVQSLKDFLDSYYSVEDRRDALSLIDEPLHLAASQFSYPITSEQAGVLLYLCGRAIDTDAIPRKTLYSLIEIVIKEERANATNC